MDKGIEALIAHMKWRIKDAAQDGHNMIGVKSDELAELIAALELAQQYSKKRDEENQDLMLTIGRLRVEREQMESAPNGMMQLSNELAEMKRKSAELELKLANPVLLPKTNGYWTEQEKAYEDAITLAKRQVRLAGFRCVGDE